MNFRYCVCVLVWLWLVLANCCVLTVATPGKMDCLSCGDECTISCGTRHFRTCCFNYMRKRGDPTAGGRWQSPLFADRELLQHLLNQAATGDDPQPVSKRTYVRSNDDQTAATVPVVPTADERPQSKLLHFYAQLGFWNGRNAAPLLRLWRSAE